MYQNMKYTTCTAVPLDINAACGLTATAEAILRIKARDQYKHLAVPPDAKPQEQQTLEVRLKAQSDNTCKQIMLPTLRSVANVPPGQQHEGKHEQLQLALNKQVARPLKLQKLEPEYHPQWKLYRVISGNKGWVHSLAVEPGNSWFVSGCRDGLIKIWDLASGRLRITLTGHIAGVRGLAVSDRHPYLFSCGDDKTVKCWDLEKNQVVRHYHGHLSGAQTLALHPTQDLLVTAGRDAVARVWDMRTKQQVHCLTGHTNTVATVQCQTIEPQIITGSHDTTIRLWDLKMARTRVTLTNHKKSIRSIAFHPNSDMFASGATDNIKQWQFPAGNFVQDLKGHQSIVNCLAINADNVLVSAADNGSMFFWDWKTGYNFQRYSSLAQPGSIDSEAGILAMTFDQSGSRLITGEIDKSIKMFKEDLTPADRG